MSSKAAMAFRRAIVSMTLGFSAAAVLVAGSVHAGSLDIVVVGASNAAGWGVGAKNAYPARLQAILRERGIEATVTSAGVIGSTTAGMLRRIDRVVPADMDIVILQPGSNDLRFFGTRERRAANISAIVERLQRRDIRVIVFDPVIPRDFLQWDGIHFTAAAHARIAMTLAEEVAGAQSAIGEPAPTEPQPVVTEP